MIMKEINKIKAIALLANGKIVKINSEIYGQIYCRMNNDGSLTNIYASDSNRILSIYDFEEPEDKFYMINKTNKDVIDILVRNQKYIQLIDFILLQEKEIRKNAIEWLNDLR